MTYDKVSHFSALTLNEKFVVDLCSTHEAKSEFSGFCLLYEDANVPPHLFLVP